MAPIAQPTHSASTTLMIQIVGWLRPMNCGSSSTWVTPTMVETNAMIEPTERSMWRMTMISTMPVAMTATDEV